MAFNLVAKLKLQDDFTNRLKKIGQQQDRFKKQISQVSDSVSSMGKKFSSAGTIAGAALNKLKEQTGRMQTAFSRASELSRNALSKIGISGQSMRNVLAKASDGAKSKIEGIGRGIRGLPARFSQAAGKIRSSLKSGIESPAISAKGAILGIATAITGSLGAVNLFQAGMDRLSTLENSKLSLGVMMGDEKEASVFMDDVLAFAKKTPFAFPDLAESARNLYAFGMDKAKVIPTLKAIGDAAAATGKGQAGLNQVTDAFGAMQIAGKVSMEEINRLQSGGVPALKILANQAGVSAAVMKKSISDGALESDKAIQQLVEGMQKGTSGIAGDTKSMAGIMEKSKKTWTGSIDSMKSAISSTMATLLEPAKPKLQAAMAWFGDTFSKIPEVAKQFAPLIKVIGVFVTSVGGIFAIVGAFTAMSAALSFLLGPIGLIALGITALVTGFALAYKNIEPFRKGVDKLVTGFQALYKMINGDGVGGLVLMKNSGFSDEEIKKVIDFTKKIREVINDVKSTFTEFSSYLSQKASGVFGPIKTALGEFAIFLAAKWEEMKPGMTMLAEAFSIGKEILVSVFQTLWSVLQPIFGALKNAFMIVADIAVIAWTNIIAPAIKFTMKIFQTLWAIVGPLLKLLGSAIGAAFEILKIVWDTIIKPVTKFLTNQFKKTLEDLSPVLDTLKGAFDIVGGAIEKVAGWFDTFKSALSKFKVPNWLSKIGGGGTVKFEGGDDGGGGAGATPGHYHGIKYVPRDNYTMRAHKGERVLTAKENKEYDKSGKGRSFVINMNGTVIREEADVDRLAEKMVRKFIAAGEGGA